MNPLPPAIRILPLSRKKEFADCKDAQEVQQKYFLNRLPYTQNGEFRFRKRPLKAPPGTIVLFQCDGAIIATAALIDTEVYKLPHQDGAYKGHLLFSVPSIRVFKPIAPKELRSVWPTFKRFNQTAHDLPVGGYTRFCKLRPEFTAALDIGLAEEVPLDGIHREGALAPITVNRYERNPKARSACIAYHGTACAACGLTMSDAYGTIADGFIHVHHLHLISSSGDERDVNPKTDLRPVCPNCHAIIHLSRKRPRTIEEVQQLCMAARPSLIERLQKAENDISVGKGAHWRKIHSDV